jgi:hypothetical protein
MKHHQRGSTSKDTLTVVLTYIVGIVLAVVVVWGLGRVSTMIYRDVAPRQAEAEREVYVNTPSYINGKNEILMKYMSEYNKAKTEQERNALKDTILNEASTVNIDKLQPNIRSFIQSL